MSGIESPTGRRTCIHLEREANQKRTLLPRQVKFASLIAASVPCAEIDAHAPGHEPDCGRYTWHRTVMSRLRTTLGKGWSSQIFC